MIPPSSYMARLDNDSYDRRDYYANPSEYYSTFSEKVSSKLTPTRKCEADGIDCTILDRTNKWGRLAIRLSEDDDP
jgi:hypothetical protein